MQTAIASLTSGQWMCADRCDGAWPLVLIDGRSRSDVWLERMTVQGPLSTRTATFGVRGAATEDLIRKVHREILGRAVQVVQVVELHGGSGMVMPLLQGRIGRVLHTSGSRNDELIVEARCDWTEQLERTIEHDLFSQRETWTVGGVLVKLRDEGLVDVEMDWLDAQMLGRRVAASVSGKQTAGTLLEALMKEGNAALQRDLAMQGDRIVARVKARPRGKGRPVGMRMGDNSDLLIEAIREHHDGRRPIKVTGVMGGQSVESTFDLVPGWNMADEGLADSEYCRSTSNAYDRVGNVYRLWVLNEDGAYSEAPFDRGPAFDLSGFFGDGRYVEPQPLRFASALSRDGSGRSLGYPVEISIDSGESWIRYGGEVLLQKDRAAVYFDDDELHDAYFNAAKAGSARVRVTATLIDPLKTEVVRWLGNPFGATFRERRYPVGDRYRWNRVGAGSRYYDEVRLGDREADEVDERDALGDWLMAQAHREDEAGEHVRMTLSGIALGLRIGDMIECAERSRHASGIDWGKRVSLQAVTYSWAKRTSELELMILSS